MSAEKGRPYLVNGATELRAMVDRVRAVPEGTRDSLARAAAVWREEFGLAQAGPPATPSGDAPRRDLTCDRGVDDGESGEAPPEAGPPFT